MEDEIIISEQETSPSPDTPVEVVDIQFRPGQKVYFFDPNGMEFAAGDHVIIDTARGAEFGYVTGGNHTIPQKDVVSPLRCVGARAKLVEEHQTSLAAFVENGYDVGHVGREGGKRLLDRLLVADIG